MNFNNSLSQNTFNKTFDSSTHRYLYHSLHKSYESNLNKINSSSKEHFSSLSNTNSSNDKKSYGNFLSKDYSKTLERFKDPTRKLEFEFPTTRATFDIPINEKSNSIYTSSLNRNSSGLYRSPLGDQSNLRTQYSSSLNNTRRSKSPSAVDTGYSSLKRTTYKSSFEQQTRTNSSPNYSNYL